MNPKSWYTSRTIWANILALLVWGFALFGVAPAMSPEVADFATAVGPAILAVVNLVLRFMTKQPVTA